MGNHQRQSFGSRKPCYGDFHQEWLKPIYNPDYKSPESSKDEKWKYTRVNDIVDAVYNQNLSDLKSVDEFVGEYQQNEAVNGKLDILICNAGVMVCSNIYCAFS